MGRVSCDLDNGFFDCRTGFEGDQLGGTGLFLGAGASFEFAMPLAWDLTSEIRAWLTPEKLRELNASWRSQGGGHSDMVIDNLVGLLLNKSIHYEQILGNLEVNLKRHGNPRQDYHGLYSWLIELVYVLLYQRHILNEKLITQSLRYLEGIAGFGVLDDAVVDIHTQSRFNHRMLGCSLRHSPRLRIFWRADASFT